VQSSTIQQTQQAGVKKMTAVSIYFRGMKKQFFMYLEHDSRGAAILPQATLNRLLEKAGLLETESYGDGFLDDLKGTGSERTMYDDFYCDRHETKSFLDMYDHIQENLDDFAGADIDGWREKVLSEGHGAFVYDW
jgi:hypothetical protein